MNVSTDTLLSKLPPYRDEWVLIKEDQKVKDIKRRIEIAHSKYAEYYDNIALYFDDDSIDKICENIYNFITRNIKYREEPVEFQTTALITGILSRGYGDCKHYALMTAGILNSIERLTGKKIDWVYRFASYRINPTPHHVFVVVFDKGSEIWIDPVPGSDIVTPNWIQDKKINIKKMALYENVAGVSTNTLMPQKKVDCGCGCNDSKMGSIVDDVKDGIDFIVSIFGGGHKPPTPQQIQAAIQDVRTNYFPGPNACVTGKELLPVYVSPGVWNRSTPCGDRCSYLRSALTSMKRTVNEEHIPNNDEKYLRAYEQVAPEYEAAYKQYCDSSYGAGSGGNGGGGGTGNGSGLDMQSFIYAGAAGLGTYFIMNKKGKKPNYTIPILVAIGTYFIVERLPNHSIFGNKLFDIYRWAKYNIGDDSTKQKVVNALKSMTESEINSVYDFLFNYYLKGRSIVPGSALYNSIIAISNKYGVFN